MGKTSVAFLLIFVVFCFKAILGEAAYGVYLYILTYFLNPGGRWWSQGLPDLRYPFTIGMVTLVAFLIRHQKYSENRFFSIPHNRWLILFTVLMILTWPIAVSSFYHEKFLLQFIKYLFMYYLIFKTIDTSEKYERMIWVFLLGQFYLGWIAREMGRSGGGRLERLGGSDSRDSNMAAALIVTSVPILLDFILNGKKWQKCSALLILVFVFNALILINSRGAFIALILSTLYYLYSQFKLPSFSTTMKLKVVFGALGAVAIFTYLADPLFWDRMTTLTVSSEEAAAGNIETGRTRTYFWLKTFDMVADHPLGLGVWGYQMVSSQYLPPDMLNESLQRRAVHSLYFQVLAEYGYHGFFLYMTFLFSMFLNMNRLKKSLRKREMIKQYSHATALEAGLLGLLTTGIFISILYSEILYWLAAFFAAYQNTYFKELKKKEIAVGR